MSFNHHSLDYSKLDSAAAQKEHPFPIFEGVEQGGYKEMSSQIVPLDTIKRASQTTPLIRMTTCKERKKKCSIIGSLCDLVLEYKGYEDLQYATAVPFTVDTPSRSEFAQEIVQVSSEPQTFSSVSQTKPSTISPAMMSHKFYPERRPGKGPMI